MPRPELFKRGGVLAGLTPLFAVLALSAMSEGGSLARAAEAASPPEPAALRVSYLVYSAKGQLPSRPSTWPHDRGLFYGEPITNVFFSTERFFGPAPAANNRPGGKGAAASDLHRNAPARPGHLAYQIDRWTGEHGLPGNKINALWQTRDGYLWLGTVGGIARFDGLRFRAFDESNTPEMQKHGSMGRTLYEDESGRVWIGTERGLLCYVSGEFVGFPGQDQILGKPVYCLARRAAGGFWFGSDHRLGFWDGVTIRWHRPELTEEVLRVLSLVETAEGHLWMGTARGLFEIDLASERVARSFLTNNSRVTIPGLLIDRRRRLWVGSNFGLWRLEPGSTNLVAMGLTERDGPHCPHVSRLTEDAAGNVWATTTVGGGLFRFPPDADETHGIQTAEEIGETLAVLVDREGAIWAGGRDKGLFRLRLRPFATLTLGDDSSLDRFCAVAEDREGSVWFSSQDGFGRWFGNNLVLFSTRKAGLDRISTLCLSRSGRMLVRFPGGGLFEPPMANDDPRLLQPVVSRFSKLEEIQAVYTRRDGSLWIGTAHGLYRATNESACERIESLAGANIRTFSEDGQGRLWIGTAGSGLVRLGPGGPRTYRSSDGLGSEQINDLHASRDGSVWVGTGSGLSRVRDDVVARFTPESGLPQQTIQCVLEDDYGRLWLSHSAGISRVARSELDGWLLDRSQPPAVASFGATDGLLNPQAAEPSQPAGLKGRDGRLWFPTRGGLAVVDPADCPTNIPPPQVMIESVTAEGTVLSADTPRRFRPGAGRQLEIRFTATSLHSPEKVRLRYRLEGQDAGWHAAGSSRLVSYSNLRPQEYRFRVQAQNHEGRWSQQEATLALHLAPYPWETWSFYLTGGFAGMGLAGIGMVWRLRRQRRHLEIERSDALEHERLRIARDMHDHLGAQLAGIALAADVERGTQERAREALSELNTLIWSVHPQNDTLPSLVDFIANFAGRYLSPAGIELDLDLPSEIPVVCISSHLRHEVAGLYKEALRNAVQHARAKRLAVSLRIEKEHLILTVRDDGGGFDASRWPAAPGLLTSGTPPRSDQRGRAKNGSGANGRDLPGEPAPPRAYRGNGLANFVSRSVALGGRCRVNSAPGQGTEVEFTLPLAPPA